jgi:hypothetical protein
MATIHTYLFLPVANNWWNDTDFIQMEKITGFRQIDFDPEDGFQSFVDACDTYWDQLDDNEKLILWEKYN